MDQETVEEVIDEPMPQPEEQEIAAMEATPDTEEPAAAEPEEWTPNYSYKVKDSEKEFDEWARPLVQNKEIEEKFRDVFSKAQGLEEVKTSRDSLKEELSAIKPDYERITSTIASLNTMVEKNDYRSFFEALQVPKEAILRYAVDELKYQEMPAEERAMIDQRRSEGERLRQLEDQNNYLTEEYKGVIQNQMQNELQSQLTKPEIAKLASDYDSRMGQPGAFQREVINRGALHEQLHKQTLSATQLVEDFARMLGGVQQPQAQTAPQIGSGQTPVVRPQDKVVLPNVLGASGSSPSKKQPRSIEDLRELRRQMTT